MTEIDSALITELSGEEAERIARECGVAVEKKAGIDVDGIMRVWGWRVLVSPLQAPKQSAGGIQFAEQTQEAEYYLTGVGRVVAIGELAFKARTSGGLQLETDTNNPKVGDIVVYPPQAGIRLQLKDGQTLRVLNDTDILGPTERPDDFRYYV